MLPYKLKIIVFFVDGNPSKNIITFTTALNFIINLIYVLNYYNIIYFSV